MKYASIVIVLFNLTSALFSQQSIGFKNPQNIRPLLDYRLPSWGYSSLMFDLECSGNGSNRTEASRESEYTNYSIQFAPKLRKYPAPTMQDI